MATETITATDELKLTPPEPVVPVAPEKAAGLVPVGDEVKSKLEEKVDGFIADLISEDENSPEFGKKVDQITNMGRKEIQEAAGQSNRFPRSGRSVRWMKKPELVRTWQNFGARLKTLTQASTVT